MKLSTCLQKNRTMEVVMRKKLHTAEADSQDGAHASNDNSRRKILMQKEAKLIMLMNIPEHVEHVMHQIANRPWSALYVAAFFFMMIALGVLAFYAIQIASQAGWSPVLFRVMEGITAYLLPGALIVVRNCCSFRVLLVITIYLYGWIQRVVEHDKLIARKIRLS